MFLKCTSQRKIKLIKPKNLFKKLHYILFNINIAKVNKFARSFNVFFIK